MKRLLKVLLCLIATLAPNYAWAQAVSYPPEVFELFVDSNAKISAHCQKNGIPKAEERNSIKPFIAIPECSEMEHLAEMVALVSPVLLEMEAREMGPSFKTVSRTRWELMSLIISLLPTMNDLL